MVGGGAKEEVLPVVASAAACCEEVVCETSLGSWPGEFLRRNEDYEKKRTELRTSRGFSQTKTKNSLSHSPYLVIVCSGSGFTYVEVCLERVGSPGFSVYTVVVAAASLSVQ